MATREEYAHRKGRESVAKRLGVVALQIKARDGHACAYCKADAISEARAGRHMHLDHLNPRDKGGKDAAKNLVVACHRCNSVRHDMNLKEWARYAGEHLKIKVDERAILAQAARPLPSRDAAVAAQAEVHARMAEAHAFEGARAQDQTVRAAHETAGALHGAAAMAGRARELLPAHGRLAAAASTAARQGPGVRHDERGRFAPA